MTPLTAVRDHQPKAKARSPVPHSQRFKAVFGCIGGSAGLRWIKTSFELYHPRSTASPSKLQPPPATSMTSLGQPMLVFPCTMVNPTATRVFEDDTTTCRMSRVVTARIRPSHGQGSRDSGHVSLPMCGVASFLPRPNPPPSRGRAGREARAPRVSSGRCRDVFAQSRGKSCRIEPRHKWRLVHEYARLGRTDMLNQ
jgi:hypothetical protein